MQGPDLGGKLLWLRCVQGLEGPGAYKRTPSFWSFFCASSSDNRLRSIYTFSSYNSRIECFRTSAFLASASTVPEVEDDVSLQEGGGNFYDGTLRESNHRFMHPLDEVQSRSVWTTTSRSNYKHLLYNVRTNAQRVCQSPDPTLWRERAPTWMRRDYWEGLCNIWATERWQETSTTMKVNRTANPEANKHTSGSVSFATHQFRLEKELKRPPTFQEVFDKTHKKKGTDQYIRDSVTTRPRRHPPGTPKVAPPPTDPKTRKG
ncbi:hypothetical protein Taro_006353 [Colocasia esculenta]|uniref:Uncharacterized protein n=1 Tax=Colocasia esculenta TaxID=4460 RepID=A0A843TSG3_COLES|nr:hypothetical protein [Colocasia esculenta]